MDGILKTSATRGRWPRSISSWKSRMNHAFDGKSPTRFLILREELRLFKKQMMASISWPQAFLYKMPAMNHMAGLDDAEDLTRTRYGTVAWAGNCPSRWGDGMFVVETVCVGARWGG